MKKTKTKKKNIIYARILLLMIMTLMVASLSGCTFAPPGDSDKVIKKDGVIIGENSFFWKGKEGHINTDASEGETFVLLGGNVNGKIELYNDKMEMWNGFFHTLSLSLYQTVFGSDELLGSDLFTNRSVVKMELSPIDVLKETNRITTTVALEKIESGGTFATLRTACTGFAGGILVIIWAMGFINSIVTERFTMESVLKGFMQLIMGMLVVLNAVEITCAFFSAGVGLVNNVADIEFTGSAFRDFKTECKNLIEGVTGIAFGFDVSLLPTLMTPVILLDFGSLLAIAYLVLPFIAMITCAYQIISAMITRMLEMMVRVLVAPIPLAMSSQTGFTSEMIRYFKHIMACALQPLLMIIGILCFDTISEVLVKIFGGTDDPSSLTGLVAVITMTFSYYLLSTFLGTTKSLANEVIAH